jgi:C-terminal processing protease CtpA/Prc
MQPNRAPLKIGNEVFLPIEIISVMPDLPAEKGGVNAGDLILKVDAKTCNEKFQTTEIVKYISAMKPGTVITFFCSQTESRLQKKLSSPKGLSCRMSRPSRSSRMNSSGTG